jgi:quercetin dioxygenase-like cupin family protein
MRTARWSVTILCGLAVTVCSLAAQQAKGGEQQILQRGDIAGTGREAVAAVHHWAPHTVTGWHSHPGEMVGFVTDGNVVIEQRGRQTLTVKAGESFIIPAGLVHNTRNDEDGEARMFVTYVVRKNAALSRGVAQ